MPTHIQINDVSPRVQYDVASAEATFSYPFAIFEDADLEVYVNGSIVTTGYTVSGAGSSAGGSVTFDVALATGDVLTLTRRLSIKRLSDFQESGEFRAKVLNDELDYLTAVLQQVEDDQGRALQLSLIETADVDVTLPSPVANTALVWNATADGIALGPSIDEVSNAQAYALNAASSASAAQTSESNAAMAQTNAAASAAIALGASTGKYDTRISITSVDSPYTVASLTADTLINADTTGGNVVINLPASAGEADGRLIAVNKVGATNTVTVNPDGADTVGGMASFVQYDDTEWADLYLDKTAGDWQLGNLSFTSAGAGLEKAGSTIGLADGGVSTAKLANGAVTAAKAAVASRAQAEAGTDTATLMTPERTAQAIAVQQSGGRVLVTTVTRTGDASGTSVDLADAFTAHSHGNFDRYEVEITALVPNNNIVALKLRYSYDGSTFHAVANSYETTFVYSTYGGGPTRSATLGAEGWLGPGYLGNASGEHYNANITFFAPHNSTAYKAYGYREHLINDSPASQIAEGIGYCGSSVNPITGFQIFASSGGIKDCIIKVFGVR